MEGISDIKIVGIDETRPPRVRKEPYIDLYFKLSHKAPQEWCDDFNGLTKRMDPSVSIDSAKGLIIETYVRDMNLIPAALEFLKKKVAATNDIYIEKILKRQAEDAAHLREIHGESGLQGKLNEIIDGLNFD